MEIYEFYVLLENMTALHSCACSTQHVPGLSALSE